MEILVKEFSKSKSLAHQLKGAFNQYRVEATKHSDTLNQTNNFYSKSIVIIDHLYYVARDQCLNLGSWTGIPG